MSRILPPKLTLAKALQSGICAVRDGVLRAANKQITSITKISAAGSVQKAFLSNNYLDSLAGIGNFPNLTVLSVSFNNISKLSEIKHIIKLPLRNINLEGNPITELPFYQHHIVAAFPSLQLLDGHEVTDELREQALTTVSFDQDTLKQIIANKLLITQLEEGYSFHGRPTIEEFGLTQQEIEGLFDEQRETALAYRNSCDGKRPKWTEVYQILLDKQEELIDSMIPSIPSPQPQTPRNTRKASVIESPPQIKQQQKPSGVLLEISMPSQFAVPLVEQSMFTSQKSIEEAHEMIRKISELEIQLEKQKRENTNLMATLELSAKQTKKLKSRVNQLKTENKHLQANLHATETQFEDDVFSLMLRQRFELDDIQSKHSVAEAKLRKIEESSPRSLSDSPPSKCYFSSDSSPVTLNM